MVEMSLIISANPAIGTIQRAPARRRPGGFAVSEEGIAEARVAAPDGVGSLAALIALQSGGEPIEDREARHYGRALLEHLDALHRALLGEGGQPDLLEALSAAASNAPGPARDPGLADAVAAIRLRAMVELARYRTA